MKTNTQDFHMPQIEIQAFGSLRSQAPQNGVQHLVSGDECSLHDLLKRLDISRKYVQLVMVNHRPVGMDAVIRSGDRVALFPQEYPIFADWNGYHAL
ncbi:MAG: MoaD/ThiS family protein [Thermodesulfobacteriota bacterium]